MTHFQVFIPKKIANNVAELFQLMVQSVGSHEKRRECFNIDYHLLGKGYMWETRFVLGKVILETMGCATSQRGEENVGEENNYIHTDNIKENLNKKLSDLVKEEVQVRKDRKQSVSLHSPEVKEQSTKKRKLVVSKCSMAEQHMTLEKQEVVERGMCQERVKKHQKIDDTEKLLREELISMLGNMSEKRCQLPDEKVTEEKKGDVEYKKRQLKVQGPLTVVEKLHCTHQEDKVAEQQAAVKTKKKAKLNETERRLNLPNEKKGDVKKTKAKLKHVGNETERRLKLPNEKKGDVNYKKHQDKDQGPSMMEEKLCHMLQEDQVAEQEDVVRTKMESKVKQVGIEIGKQLQLPDEKVIEKKKGAVKYKKHPKVDRPSVVVEKLQQEDMIAKQEDVVETKTEAKLKQVGKETGRGLLLSDLFK